MQKEQIQSKPFNRISVTVILLVLLFLGLLLHVVYILYNTFSTTHPDLSEVSRIISLKFPEGSKLLGSVMYGGQDHLLQVAVEMENNQVESFVSDINSVYSVSKGSRLTERRGDPQWWKPDSNRKSMAISGVPRPGVRAHYIDVVVSHAYDQRVIVYLEWAGKL